MRLPYDTTGDLERIKARVQGVQLDDDRTRGVVRDLTGSAEVKSDLAGSMDWLDLPLAFSALRNHSCTSGSVTWKI